MYGQVPSTTPRSSQQPHAPPPTRASLSSQAADREWIVFLIDASPAMLARAPPSVAASVPGSSPSSTPRTYLDVAVECAQGTLRSRIVSAPSDKQAVVFFATRETRGVDDAASGLSAREGVYQLGPAPGRAERAADPGSRRPPRPRGRRAVPGEDRLDGGARGLGARRPGPGRVLRRPPPRAPRVPRDARRSRRARGGAAAAARTATSVLLFTNRDDPRTPAPNPAEEGAAATRRRDGRELAAQWREFRDVHGIDVCLFTLPTTPVGDRGLGVDGARAFDASCFYALAFSPSPTLASDRRRRRRRRGGSTRGSRAGTSSSGATRPAARRSSPRARNSWRARRTRSTTLRFGPGENHRIAICLHAPLAAAARPKAIQVHARDLTKVHSDAVFVSKFAGEFVSREHLTRRFVDPGDARTRLTLARSSRGEALVRRRGRARPRLPPARVDDV